MNIIADVFESAIADIAIVVYFEITYIGDRVCEGVHWQAPNIITPAVAAHDER